MQTHTYYKPYNITWLRFYILLLRFIDLTKTTFHLSCKISFMYDIIVTRGFTKGVKYGKCNNLYLQVFMTTSRTTCNLNCVKGKSQCGRNNKTHQLTQRSVWSYNFHEGW